MKKMENGEFKALHSELHRSMSIGLKKTLLKRMRNGLVIPITRRTIGQKMSELQSFSFCSIFVSMVAKIDKNISYR